MITARSDFPYTNRPDLHVFAPTLETFKAQTFTDFEWVVVDALYDQRKDYFADLKVPFKIKHVPALPNFWIENGLPGICEQYNKGIIHADGELCFFTGDSHMVQPNFMELMWKYYQKGFFPLAWYFYDNSFSQLANDPNLKSPEHFAEGFPDRYGAAPVKYDILGFKGEQTEKEHRYTKCFKETTAHICSVNWDWWFGCSSASLESILKINGFNQNFDGDQMLLDCDVGSRLDLAGYGIRFAMFRDFYLIKIASDRKWNPKFTRKDVTIKCNLPLIHYNRCFNRPQANLKPLSEQDIDWIKHEFCGNRCQMREFCKKNHPWQYPFEHKDGFNGHNSKREWFELWQKKQMQTVDLVEERKLRIKGDSKYSKGTFV